MSNVIQFPKRPTIFSDRQKAHLSDSIKDLHEKPEVIVDRFETAICTEIVGAAREVAATAGEALGNKIASWLFGEKK